MHVRIQQRALLISPSTRSTVNNHLHLHTAYQQAKTCTYVSLNNEIDLVLETPSYNILGNDETFVSPCHNIAT